MAGLVTDRSACSRPAEQFADPVAELSRAEQPSAELDWAGIVLRIAQHAHYVDSD